ncbi:PHP domain-containing protein [Candidatus Woesearchaeota archaeon]|nr:PHP domain-containing protein [Candidatus Woesearchaeota archaeon]
MLKADLHLHTSEDPEDSHISYTAKELIEYASELGFEVLSITNHNQLYYNQNIKKFAEKKGILLIPGTEISIKRKDVLVYNISKKDFAKIKNLEDIEKLKKRNKNMMVIAPHPYYFWRSLGRDLVKKIKIFDAIEYSHFYSKKLNAMNKKAARVAHEYNKALVGTSDAHNLWRLNSTYSLINSKKEIKSVIEAIKKNKVKIVSKPLSPFKYLRIIFSLLIYRIIKKIYKQKRKI